MKPILFNTQMVQALLNTKIGSFPAEPIDKGKPFKSMTRRVIAPQPRYQLKEHKGGWHEYSENPIADDICNSPWGRGFPCKYKVGDILWVRETWTKFHDAYWYKSDIPESVIPLMEAQGEVWRPSICLPREAARLFLEVKRVQIERLQDITVEGLWKEGIDVGNEWVWVYEFMRIENGNKRKA